MDVMSTNNINIRFDVAVLALKINQPALTSFRHSKDIFLISIINV